MYLHSEDPNVYPLFYPSKMKEWQCGNSYSTSNLQFERIFIGGNELNVKYIANDDDFFIMVDPDLQKIDYASVIAIEK